MRPVLLVIATVAFALGAWFVTQPQQPALFLPPHRSLTAINDADSTAIRRHVARGEYAEANARLLQAIQIGPIEPTLGAACREEFRLSGEEAVHQCMMDVLRRRAAEEEIERTRRAYRASY